MGALTIPREQEIVKELAQINNEFTQGIRKTAALGIRAGALLSEVKAALPHGQWMSWVKLHCTFSQRAANMYLNAFQVKSATVANLTGEETLVQLAAMLNAKPEAEAPPKPEAVFKDAKGNPPPGPIGSHKGEYQLDEGEWVEGDKEVEAPPQKPAPQEPPKKHWTEEPDEEWDSDTPQTQLQVQQQELEWQIESKPESVLGLAIIKLLAIDDEPTIKAVKSILARAYHPDTGRISKDEKLMATFNRCFDSIAKRKK